MVNDSKLSLLIKTIYDLNIILYAIIIIDNNIPSLIKYAVFSKN